MPIHEQDKRMIEKLISSAPGIMEEFRRNYFNTALKLARAYNLSEDDAEDAFQEALVSVYKNAKRYGLDFLTNARLNTYIYTICRNQLQTISRRNNRIFNENVIKELDAVLIGKDEYLQWVLDKRARIDKLEEIVLQMKEPCKTFLTEYYVNYLKHKEIAEKYNLETNAIGMNIKRCLEKFREMLPNFD